MKKIDWMKFRIIYAVISLTVIGIGLFSFFKWGFALGVDFRGGSLIDYKFEKSVVQDKLSDEISKLGVTVQSVQSAENGTYLFRLGSLESGKKDEIKKKLEEVSGGTVEELRYEDVGPTIGSELIKKTLAALLLASSAILIWIAYQFKSIKLGVCATLATLHDALVLLGCFAFLGHFFGAELDFLFITALLTVLSFSVHDTIVVYDRIREIRRKQGGEVYDIANIALTETMRRSVNNSLTIIFMLVALVLLGGITIRWFAVALLIGTISGTYSSPFVAVPILVTWEEISRKLRRRND